MPSVLVVDDHVENCRPLVRLLKVLGHEAAWVTSGPEALAFVGREATKMLILDVMMPGMDGFDVLRAIRADRRLDRLPVVMFSAVNDPRRVDEARRLGAQDYLVKGGTDFDTLRAVVEKYVRPADLTRPNLPLLRTSQRAGSDNITHAGAAGAAGAAGVSAEGTGGRTEGATMTVAHKMLLETLAGHFAWLKDAHPGKAASPAARKAERSVQLRLRAAGPNRKVA